MPRQGTTLHHDTPGCGEAPGSSLLQEPGHLRRAGARRRDPSRVDRRLEVGL